MTKLRNIAFIILAIAVTLIVAGGQAYDLATGQERSSHTYLEGREYQEAPEISLSNISSGTYQKQVEKYLADHIPHRDGILIYNAQLQRNAIMMANAPFGFEGVPTFYDSSTIWCASVDALLDQPMLKRNCPAEKVEASAANWASLIEGSPDTNWCFALVDRAYTSEASPAYGLVTDPADYKYFHSILESTLPDTCALPDLSYANVEDFLSDYYRTDHHWQIQGGIRAYERIMNSLGKTPIDVGGYHVAFKGPFYGSGARRGLMATESDVVYDADYAPSGFSVSANGKPRERSEVDESFADDYTGYTKNAKYENVYGTYFHGDWTLLEYSNPSAPNGTLLIIGDSYTNCIDHIFAESYQHVYVVDPRYYKGSLVEYVGKLAPDDAVVMLGANNVIDKEINSKLK